VPDLSRDKLFQVDYFQANEKLALSQNVTQVLLKDLAKLDSLLMDKVIAASSTVPAKLKLPINIPKASLKIASPECRIHFQRFVHYMPTALRTSTTASSALG
jgi:hypothetical protein